MSWFDCLYRMCCCSICCDQRLSLLQLSDLPVVSKNSRTTWYRWLPPNFYDLLNRIRCSDHWLQVCNHCQGILKLALKTSCSWNHRSVLTTIRSMQVCFNPIRRKFLLFCSCCCLALHEQFKFQAATQFLWFIVLPLTFWQQSWLCISSYCLTVLTCCQRILNLALSEGNNAEERGATLQDHCGAAFQVAHRIAPFMQLQVSLQRPARIS